MEPEVIKGKLLKFVKVLFKNEYRIDNMKKKQKEEEEEKVENSGDNIETGKRKKYLHYSLLYIFFFSTYRFTFAMLLAFINNMMLPKDINLLVGEKAKSTVLGIVLGVVSGTYMTGPLIGSISDKAPFLKIGKIELGKRLPLLFFSVILYFLTILLRSVFRNSNVLLFSTYVLLSVFGSWFSCVSQITYTALIPDLFHPKQFDIVSGALGFTNLLGQTVALGVFGLIYTEINYYLLVFSVVVLSFIGILPLLFFRESNGVHYKQMKSKKIQKSASPAFKFTKENIIKLLNSAYKALISFLTPFKHWNFSVTFFARFCFIFGYASISGFQLYFLKDCVKTFTFFGLPVVSNENGAQGIASYVMFAFGIFAAFGGPLLSKKISRKFTLFLSGITMIVAMLAWIITRNYTIFLLFSSFFGAGVASMNAVFFALIAQVLPNPADAGKDLAIFGLANIVPYSVASPLMGILIEFGNGLNFIPNFGYYLLFLVAISLTLIGTIAILFVKNKKKEKIKTSELLDKEFEDDEDNTLKESFIKETQAIEELEASFELEKDQDKIIDVPVDSTEEISIK